LLGTPAAKFGVSVVTAVHASAQAAETYHHRTRRRDMPALLPSGAKAHEYAAVDWQIRRIALMMDKAKQFQ
jgi:hypothetical protein